MIRLYKWGMQGLQFGSLGLYQRAVRSGASAVGGGYRKIGEVRFFNLGNY